MRRQRSTARLGLLLLLCLSSAAARPSTAQPATLSVYQDLALECLGRVPDTLRAFRLEASERLPYLSPPLVARWQAEARTLFVPDTSDAQPALPRLAYEVEEAAVTYERAGGNQLRRSVALGLHYRLVDADGRLLADGRCRPTFEDVVARRAVPGLEHEAFPETRAELPPDGWLRRYAQPALLTAATAVGVYLLFTLRSQAADQP